MQGWNLPAAADAAATHTPSNADHRQPTLEFFYRVAERFGLPVVILIMVLWWARTDIVQPLLDAHFSLIKKITEGQDAQVRHLDMLNSKMDRLITIQASQAAGPDK
jgi:hypothetical protein